MEMPVVNMPDINMVQGIDTTPVNTNLSASISQTDNSQFSVLMNQQIYNYSMNRANQEQGQNTGQNVQEENGSVTRDILTKLLSSKPAANMDDLQNNIISALEHKQVEEGTLAIKQHLVSSNEDYELISSGTDNYLLTEMHLASGSKDLKETEKISNESESHLGKIVNIKSEDINNETADESPVQTENAADSHTPVEALLSNVLLNALQNIAAENMGDDVPVDPANPTVNACLFQDAVPSGSSQQNSILSKAPESTNANQATIPYLQNEAQKKLLAEELPLAAKHNEMSSAEPISSMIETETSEYADNKGQHQTRIVYAQKNTVHSDIAKCNDVSKETQNNMMPEILKEPHNTNEFVNVQDKLAKEPSLDMTSDKTGSMDQSHIAFGNSKAGGEIISRYVERPAGFTQVLDSIVYVIKGNSKLGVSVEHDALGKLDINLSIEKGLINVHINASDKGARELIQDNVQYIMDALMKEGLNVSGFSVGFKERKNNDGYGVAQGNNKDFEKEILRTEEKKQAPKGLGLINIFA
ncbi:MAG: flagellar hook-length control protein FliK [Nitrospiraceae bacterium]|nr:MAG: flagellar hook-length control protein FliK [Nitrospiraceae bacterium]